MNEERKEDLDKIIQLKRRVKSVTKKLCQAKEDMRCRICYQREIDCIIQDCKHYVICMKCGELIQQCPICRREI